ncbi:MAG TPA: hypothetical protein VNE63_00980 [Candidatus Acidoferrales bacterium]|nr:hypothetical protein [Candidatus Acidoferrales bacterium]
MDDWAELGRALDALAASGSAEVREDGEWLPEFAVLHCEVRGQGKTSLVHLWSDGRNLTRRILRIKKQSEQHIILEVQRFGRSKPSRLEFLRTEGTRSSGRIARAEFRVRFRRVLSERFPDAIFECLTISPDLGHSFSGLYVRGRMHEGRSSWAVLAVPPREGAAGIDGMLTFGILWLDWTRSHAERHAVEGLRLFVPEGTSRFLRERVMSLSSAARTEIFEFREQDGRIHKMDTADGNLESLLATRRTSESVLAAARAAAERIPVLASALSTETRIEVRALPGMKEVGFYFRGFEFARWSIERMLFELVDTRQRFTAGTQPALERLLRQLNQHRDELASETNHPLYRAAPERWLETIILKDPTRLDAQLDSQHVYSQVPTVTAGDRGVLDLLGVTRRGRLVVIELKASENIQMPIQAVDYWLRVRRHQREGDFQRCGYFVGREIDPRPPLVWLVAPALQFHSATDRLLKYLSPEIQVTRIGLNENWRRGLRVVYRQQGFPRAEDSLGRKEKGKRTE